MKRVAPLLLLVLALTGCASGRIRAEADSYATISAANAQATAQAVENAHNSQKNADSEELTESTMDDAIFARSLVLQVGGVSLAGLIIVAAFSGGYAMAGRARAAVRGANANADAAERAAGYVTIALDPKTRQYPLVLSPSGRHLLVPGAGLVLDMTQMTTADRTLAAGMSYTQAAGTIAQEARRARASTSEGVAGVNPAVIETK